MKIVDNKSVLIVDDDQTFLDILARFMEHYGFQPVYRASNGREALDIFRQHPTDLLVTDINMPEVSGMQLMEEVRRIDTEVPIIVVSGWIKEEHLPRLEPFRVTDTIFKPFRMDRIRSVIEGLFGEEA